MMTRSLFFTLSLAALTTASGAQAKDAAFQAAAARMAVLVQATRSVPGATPGLAVVMTARGEAPIIITDGVARIGGGAVTGDTPFYIASMTKAYVGLLAARMEDEGVLPLTASLHDVWPDLTLPGGMDPAKITFEQLLSHQHPIKNDTLSFRTAQTDDVPAADYPALLAAWSQPRDTAFAYSNVGYLLYGAAIEARTGRSWRDLLGEKVLSPLHMDHTSNKTSDFKAGDLAFAHQALPNDWRSVPPKDDALMHAAGGTVTSAKDMARWLQAHVDKKGLPRAVFVRAQTPLGASGAKRAGMACDGYALGWYVCDAAGQKVLEHGGGYDGFRAEMMFMPDRGVGFAVMTNSDAMTGQLTTDLVQAFVTAMTDPQKPLDEAAIVQRHADGIAEQVAAKLRREAKRRADPQWGGWTWRPTQVETAALVGAYRSAQLGDIRVMRAAAGGLTAVWGVKQLALQPAAPGLFAATQAPLSDIIPVKFEPGRLAVDGDVFQRVGD